VHRAGQQRRHGAHLAGGLDKRDHEVDHAVVGDLLNPLVHDVDTHTEGHQDDRQAGEPPGGLPRRVRAGAVGQPQEDQDRHTEQPPRQQFTQGPFRQAEQAWDEAARRSSHSRPARAGAGSRQHDDHRGDRPAEAERARLASHPEEQQQRGRCEELDVAQISMNERSLFDGPPR
jgi:hypothetical protein